MAAGGRGGGGRRRGGAKTRGLAVLDLPQDLQAGPRAGYLLLGPERFLQTEALRILQGALLGPHPGPSLSEMDASKVGLAAVLDELRTFPFFGAGRRLVILRDAKAFLSEHGEALVAFLQDPPDTATLVLTAAKLDGRSKSTKALKEAMRVVDCGSFDEAGLRRFVRRRAKFWGRPFARGADGALLDRLGGQDVELGLLDAEVRKLVSAATDGPITRQQVEDLASFGSSEESFGLIDRVARGDVSGALLRLRSMFRDGLVSSGGNRVRDASGIAMILLPTLRWDLTRLLKGRALLDRGAAPRAITEELRVWKDKPTFLRRIQRADRDALAARHAVLRAADAAVRSSADPEGTITDVIARLALAER